MKKTIIFTVLILSTLLALPVWGGDKLLLEIIKILAKIGLCGNYDLGQCSLYLPDALLIPLSNYATSFILISALLFFVRREVVTLWMWFSLAYLLLSIPVVFTAPLQTSWISTGFDTRNQLSFWFSALFLLISFILIIYKSIKLKGK
jgi:hypothetical protein